MLASRLQMIVIVAFRNVIAFVLEKIVGWPTKRTANKQNVTNLNKYCSLLKIHKQVHIMR